MAMPPKSKPPATRSRTAPKTERGQSSRRQGTGRAGPAVPESPADDDAVRRRRATPAPGTSGTDFSTNPATDAAQTRRRPRPTASGPGSDEVRSSAGPRRPGPANPRAGAPLGSGRSAAPGGIGSRTRPIGTAPTTPTGKRGDGPRHDGGYGPPEQRPQAVADLEVEPARKMRVRRGSEKQELVVQQLRQKRVDPDHISPLRLQKALALSGVGSRRECDDWVTQGRVSIDGSIATPGARVAPGQVVRFDGRIVQIKWPDRLPRVLLYHKQEGELVSRDDPEGRTTVFERLPKLQSSAWVAIGRLDFNTSGLLVFTTSGDLANRMMHPRFEVEREYAVRVLGTLTEEQRKEILAGVELDDGPAHFEVLEDQGGEGKNHWYRVILREGRNREIRRVFEHYELTVSRLMRVRFGILSLPGRLKRGEYYELNETEVLGVLKWAGLGMTGRAGHDAR